MSIWCNSVMILAEEEKQDCPGHKGKHTKEDCVKMKGERLAKSRPSRQFSGNSKSGLPVKISK